MTRVIDAVLKRPVQHHIEWNLYANWVLVENRIVQLPHYTHEGSIGLFEALDGLLPSGCGGVRDRRLSRLTFNPRPSDAFDHRAGVVEFCG